MAGNSKGGDPGRALFGEVRLAMLLELFGHPARAFEARELVRLTGCALASVRRELTLLVSAALVIKRVQNERVRFQANATSRLYAPLHLLAQELGGIFAPGADAGSARSGPAHQPRASSREQRPQQITPALYDQHFVFIAITMNRWVLRHLSRIYERFQGDFIAALILGEVAHHNVSTLAPALDYDRDKMRAAVTGPDGLRAMEPCNAFSISEATGVPRETVRRKVRELVKRGWLIQNDKSEIFISPDVGRDFNSANFASATELLETADRLRARIFR